MQEGTVYDPITNEKQPWINIYKLCALYKYNQSYLNSSSSLCVVM